MVVKELMKVHSAPLYVQLMKRSSNLLTKSIFCFKYVYEHTHIYIYIYKTHCIVLRRFWCIDLLVSSSCRVVPLRKQSHMT